MTISAKVAAVGAFETLPDVATGFFLPLPRALPDEAPRVRDESPPTFTAGMGQRVSVATVTRRAHRPGCSITILLKGNHQSDFTFHLLGNGCLILRRQDSNRVAQSLPRAFGHSSRSKRDGIEVDRGSRRSGTLILGLGFGGSSASTLARKLACVGDGQLCQIAL